MIIRVKMLCFSLQSKKIKHKKEADKKKLELYNNKKSIKQK